MTTFRTSRQLAASPAAIFAAIQNAERLARWWGPNGFSNRFESFDFRVGGKWIFCMVGPDGSSYPNEVLFTAIETDRKLVLRHVCAPHFQLSLTLEANAEGTLVHWEQVFDDAQVAQALQHIVVPANEQNLDRLSAELSTARSAATPQNQS